MDKKIVFVGGVTNGVNKFEAFLKSSHRVRDNDLNYLIEKIVMKEFSISKKDNDGEFNPEFFQAVEDIRNIANVSFDFETRKTGEAIKEFLSDNNEYLIIHKSSEDMRETVCKIEDAVQVPIFRIFFGYKDDLPNGFDYNVNPNSSNFSERVMDILNLRERIA